MNFSSSLTSVWMSDVRASGSKVGRPIRAAERFIRAMFMSGLNRAGCPPSGLYAFMPDKRSTTKRVRLWTGTSPVGRAQKELVGRLARHPLKQSRVTERVSL